MTVQAIPNGYHSITPYLITHDAPAAIDFDKKAFGATEKKPLADQFDGDRSGTVEDPFGHLWTVATHTEDVSPEEIERRFQEMMSHMGA